MCTFSVYAGGSKSTSSTSKSKPTTSAKKVSKLYKEGKFLADTWNYSEALEKFEAAYKLDKKNADVLNMMAYSQRKLGLLDKAFKNYKRALRLKPEFPEAREYLAEAHIQAALREAKILKSYGSNAEVEMEELIKCFLDAVLELNLSQK